MITKFHHHIRRHVIYREEVNTMKVNNFQMVFMTFVCVSFVKKNQNISQTTEIEVSMDQTRTISCVQCVTKGAVSDKGLMFPFSIKQLVTR